MAKSVHLGILGCGTVGSALIDLIHTRHSELAVRSDVDLQVQRVAVRDLSAQRSVALSDGVLTDDPAQVVNDPEIDIVVELMGGTDPARDLVATALKSAKPVVTANKALVATSGAGLFELAEAAGVDFLFEAAVGGGIPLIRALRESLAGERIDRIVGIVNGTTNYILTEMAEEHIGFADALRQAQQLGYAEADPTADVEGNDAAAKAVILAALAFGAWVPLDSVHREGLTVLTDEDADFAARLGHVIKLVAIAARTDDPSRIELRVHPALVPGRHPLASVRGANNALFIEGGAVGEMLFAGAGAGGLPTASAVLGDVLDAAHNLAVGGHGLGMQGATAEVAPIALQQFRFILCVDVIDKPGVLATVADVFGTAGVSIRSMEQVGLGNEARLMFVTHAAVDSAMQITYDRLSALEVVRKVGTPIRFLDTD